MTGRTHDLAAFTLLNIIFVTTPVVPTISVATGIGAIGLCFIGGLTPDIDQPTADLWNRIPAGNIIGRMITPLLGSHRMVSHSFLGIGLFGFFSYQLFQMLSSVILIDMKIVWISFMTGFLSHLIVDIFNKDGIPLLFPIPWKFGVPPLRFLRITTGGVAEKTLLYPALMIINAYLVYENYQIYLRFFSQFLKN